ncbi:YdeI/OmpD-associated family protein [Actinotalea sp. M2MS4P-6]|uniref:YdeI/OmpD-associated family protein n=1 Tax=Actinotalea sp. M2MS4P-6 TaxID=2983762 RepID=UPI0021E46A7D|nr:YdeI/OmpD-associated family protein [Actinotalea sp. M2MS4P-6]MCV2393001.1 YdeI/OmpD-associated family protein [Actinotalea sp. M2MS4P-6]
MAELIELLLPDAAAWRDWLDRHGADSPGVWLVLTKKGGTTTRLGYEDAVDEAIAQGWIDGQLRTRDAETMAIRFTPRRARSPWSQRNVERVARLEREGRMQPAGLAQVSAAKADGRWERAYGGSAATAPPQDLLDALAAEPRAQAWWDVLTRTNRFAICYRLQDAKRPETRARRLAAFVADLAEGRTPYPQKARPEMR